MKKIVAGLVGGVVLTLSSMVNAEIVQGPVTFLAVENDANGVSMLAAVNGRYAFYRGPNTALAGLLSDAYYSGKNARMQVSNTAQIIGVYKAN
jgi:hypothetical protein